MATRWCPSCGAEYLDTVQECVDCAVPLVDERPLSPEEVGEPEDEQLVYELDEYDKEGRMMVDRLLTGEAIAHAGEGATLVVRAADEAAVDHILEQVEVVTGLDPDAEQVVYELGDWPEEQRAQLVDALVADAIAFEWDENGDLAVLEADEDRVEAMLDAIEYPDALPAAAEDGDDDAGEGGDDGLLAQDTLSELFVAADRLMHDAEDAEGVIALVDHAEIATGLPLPFGFAPAVWADIIEQATALRARLEGAEADDEEIKERARTLRSLLRNYV